MDSKKYQFNLKHFYINLFIVPPWLVISIIFFYFYSLTDNKYILVILPLFFLLLAIIYYFNMLLLYKLDRNTIFCFENQNFQISNPKRTTIHFSIADIQYIEKHAACFISGLNKIEYTSIFLKDGSNVKITCYLPVEEIIQQVDPSKVFKSVSPLLVGLMKK